MLEENKDFLLVFSSEMCDAVYDRQEEILSGILQFIGEYVNLTMRLCQ